MSTGDGMAFAAAAMSPFACAQVPARRGGRRQQGQPERDQESKNATMNAEASNFSPVCGKVGKFTPTLWGTNQEVECRGIVRLAV